MSFLKTVLLLLSISELISAGKVVTTENDGKLECPQNMAVNKLMVNKDSKGFSYTVECENTTSCASNCKYISSECSPSTFGNGSYLRGIRVTKPTRMELYCCESDGGVTDCETPKYGSSVPYSITGGNKKKVMHTVINKNGGLTVRMCSLKPKSEPPPPCPLLFGGKGKEDPVIVVVAGGFPRIVLPKVPTPATTTTTTTTTTTIPTTTTTTLTTTTTTICNPTIPAGSPKCEEGTCVDTTGTTLPGSTARGDCINACLSNPKCLAFNFKGAVCVIYDQPCVAGLNTGGNYCTVKRRC